MKKLIKGLHKFQTEVYALQKDFFQKLAQGQHPEVFFITCSDSRVNPNLVTSSDPGDIFIMRNAGNIVPPFGAGGSEQATIEFAMSKLNIKDIILCGHSYCGAIEAALQMETIKNTPSLYTWIEANISPTYELVKENYTVADRQDLMNILTQEHVLKQVENLKTHPIIADVIAQNKLSLHAWVYQFENGEIFSYNMADEQFEKIRAF